MKVSAATAKYRFFSLAVTFWFFVALESVLIWNPFEKVIRVLAFLGMAAASLLVFGTSNKGFRKRSYTIFLFASLFILWLTYALSESWSMVFSYFVKFVPLLLVLFWPADILNEGYKYIRVGVLVFAVGGAIVSALTLAGLISHIPHIVLPPQETLHERLGYEYYVYGFIPTLHDPLSVQSARTCGMMKEPGHFAIILGFIYLIDRFREEKISLWIILAGILTFSSNFFIMVAITELRYVFNKRYFAKFLKYTVLATAALTTVFLLLPSGIRDQIYYLFIERNLADVFEALKSSSSLSEGLDMRANVNSVFIFDHISTEEFLFGGVEFDSSLSLADYRGLILRVGLVGMILSFLTIFSTIKVKKTSLQISLLLIYILILAHRSWMLQSPYIYFLSFMAVMIYSYRSMERERVLIK